MQYSGVCDSCAVAGRLPKESTSRLLPIAPVQQVLRRAETNCSRGRRAIVTCAERLKLEFAAADTF